MTEQDNDSGDLPSAVQTLAQAAATLAAALEQVRACLPAPSPDWDRESRRYALERLDPGVFVYSLRQEAADGEPYHALCPSCYQRRHKAILQYEAASETTGDLVCPDCGTRLRIVVVPPPPRSGHIAIHGENETAWMKS